MNNVAVTQKIVKTTIAKSFFDAKYVTSIVIADLFCNSFELFTKNIELLNHCSELDPILRGLCFSDSTKKDISDGKRALPSAHSTCDIPAISLEPKKR